MYLGTRRIHVAGASLKNGCELSSWIRKNRVIYRSIHSFPYEWDAENWAEDNKINLDKWVVFNPAEELV